MELIHISYGGPNVRLKVDGKYHTFEMHPYCGPIKLKADLEPSERQWSERSPFWPVFKQWMKCGQKVDEHGRGLIR